MVASNFAWSLAFLFLVSCAQQQVVRDVRKPSNRSTAADEILIDHTFFQIRYSKSFRLPRVVKYVLTAENLKKRVAKRRDRFKADPKLIELKLAAVKPSEYVGSGYDKGHMAPSADFLWSQEANDTTFYMSNMTPQKPKLNQDAWANLEDRVREWACGEERVLLFTGPILEDKLDTLKGGLAIPKAFFKVIIDDTPPRKVLAFIFYQDDKGDITEDRVVSMKKIEVETGETFVSEVPAEDKGIFREEPSIKLWKTAKCDS